LVLAYVLPFISPMADQNYLRINVHIETLAL